MTRARDLADFNLDGKAVTINESSADLDFRVESDNATNALFVQGSDGKVGVNTAAPNLQMSVNFDTSAVAGFGLHDTNSGNLGGMLQFYSGSGQGTLRANIMNANNAGVHAALGTSGSVVFGGTSYTAANALDSYEEGTWTIDNNGDSTGVISAEEAFYTRIGNVVNVWGQFNTSANFTSTSIGGLPFNVKNAFTLSIFGSTGVVMGSNLAAGFGIFCVASESSDLISFREGSDAGDNHTPNTTNDIYRFHLTYMAD